MARLTLLLALFATLAVAAWAGRFEFDERALLAELEGRPVSPHASLLSLGDLSPDSLALLQADGHDVASPQSLLQIKAEATATDDASDTLLMEVSAQAQPESDLHSINAQAKKEFEEGLQQYNEAQAESQGHSFVEMDAEAETEAEAEVYADAESYVEANPHLFTEMAAEADAGADADVDTEAEAEAAMQAEAETEAGAEAQFLSATTLESEHFDSQAALAQEQVPMPGMSVDGAAEMDADFPEASAALVEMQSQASAAAAVMATAQARVEGLLENRGRLGNYPGWNPTALLEMMAEAEPAAAPAATPAPAAVAVAAPAPVPAAAGAQPVVAATADSPADPTAGQFSPVVKNLPPESANVKHISLNQGTGGASLPNAGELGVSKVNVHVYGAPDIDQDKQAALKSMVRRLADNQSQSYTKINTLLKKLKLCQINGKTKDCLPKITEKIEDFKAEWLADAKRV